MASSAATWSSDRFNQGHGCLGGMSPVGSGSSVRDDGESCHGSSGKVGSSGRSAPRGLVRRIRSGAGISKQRLPHTIQLFDSTLPLAIARREQQGGEVVGSHGGHRRCLVSLSCCHHECTSLRLAAAGDQAAVVSRSVGIASAVGHLVSQSFGQSVIWSVSQSVTWSVVGRRSSVVGRSVVGQSVVGRSVGRWSVGHSVGRLVPRERRSRASASGVEASGVEASGERQARLIGTS